ncbi:hypothetical protein ACKX2D_07445 [Lachnospiraceae bacterium YH-ros2226]
MIYAPVRSMTGLPFAGRKSADGNRRSEIGGGKSAVENRRMEIDGRKSRSEELSE